MVRITFVYSDKDSDEWGADGVIEVVNDDEGLNKRREFLIDDETNEEINKYIRGIIKDVQL